MITIHPTTPFCVSVKPRQARMRMLRVCLPFLFVTSVPGADPYDGGNGGLHILDVSDPTALRQIGEYHGGGQYVDGLWPVGIEVVGDKAYFAAGPLGLRFYPARRQGCHQRASGERVFA